MCALNDHVVVLSAESTTWAVILSASIVMNLFAFLHPKCLKSQWVLRTDPVAGAMLVARDGLVPTTLAIAMMSSNWFA